MVPIEGYENRYSIAKNGDIYSYSKKTLMAKPYLDKSTGYLKIALCKNGNKKIHLFHRVLAKAYIPNPNNLPIIDHKNRIRTDNRLENLRWVSKAGNLNNKGPYKNNTTGYTNISKEGKYYRVKISHYGEKFNALRSTLEEAVCQRNILLSMLDKEPITID